MSNLDWAGLFDRGEQCDVDINCNAISFEAHGLILSLQSPYLKREIDDERWNDPGGTPQIELRHDDDVVKSVVRTFYTGKFDRVEAVNHGPVDAPRLSNMMFCANALVLATELELPIATIENVFNPALSDACSGNHEHPEFLAIVEGTVKSIKWEGRYKTLRPWFIHAYINDPAVRPVLNERLQYHPQVLAHMCEKLAESLKEKTHAQ